jgi:hypothetical protein
MASRALQPVSWTSIHGSNEFPLVLRGAGASAPTFDPGNTPFFSIVRNSAGNYTLTSKDKWNKCPSYGAWATPAAAGSTKTIGQALQVQNANKTWSFTFIWLVSGTPTDIPAGDAANVYIVFSNSTVVP